MKMFIFSLIGDTDIVYQVMADSKGDAYEMLHYFEPSIPLRALVNDYICEEVRYKGTILKHDFTKPIGGIDGNYINDFIHLEYEDFDDRNPAPTDEDEDFEEPEPFDFGDYDNDMDIDEYEGW